MKNSKTLDQAWDQASDQILTTAINGLNEATSRARNRQLSEFTTEALQKELLSRQKCQFGRLACTEKAEVYLIKPQQPACANCQQDILVLTK